MKIRKVFLSCVLVVVTVLVCLLALPTDAKAAEYADGDYIYRVSNAEATITYVDLSICGDITIPGVLGGYPVTAIGPNAFSGRDGLTGVTIADSVITIGHGAFSGCASLAEVVIPDSVETIADFAFGSCTSLTSITIPDSVSVIGYQSFYGCDRLARVTIGRGVTCIGALAFDSCKNLTDLYITDASAWCKIDFDDGSPQFHSGKMHILDTKGAELTEIVLDDSVTKIPAYAFKGATNLTRITVSASLTLIGLDAFSGCTGLQYNVYNGVNYLGTNKNPYFALIAPANVVPESCKVHNDTKIIAEYAFVDTGVTAVTMPEGLNVIGGGAFAGCWVLSNVTIPDSVTYIGYNAFYGCNKLRYNVYDNARYLGNSKNPYVMLLKAEAGDGEILYSCLIHNDTKIIGSSAFSGCGDLHGVDIPDSVIAISDYAFSGCENMESLTIGSSVITIGFRAFYGSSSLISVTIPDSVITIDKEAFSHCAGLTSVSIPDSVTTIGECAFSPCASLTSVSIPDSVITIGDSAFSSCDSLTGIWVDANNENYSSDEFGVLYNKDRTVLINAPGTITNYVIPEGVKEICAFAFRNCKKITDITIPASLIQVGEDAFQDCSLLKNVHISDLSAWCGIDFCNTWSNPLSYSHIALAVPHEIYLNGEAIRDLVIPDDVKTIGSHAFYRCYGIRSITIHDDVVSIGSYGFYFCYYLSNLNLGNGVKDIGAMAFSCCDFLLSVTIPDSVIFVGNSAFRDCWNLKSVSVGNGVTVLSDGIFAQCRSLTEISYSCSVSTIGQWAFSECSALTSITIPDSVTEIDSYAFYDCGILESVYIGSGVAHIGNHAFRACDNLTGIWVDAESPYFSSDDCGVLFDKGKTALIAAPKTIASYSIPDGVVAIKKNAFFACSSLTDITIPNSVTIIEEGAFQYCEGITSVTVGNRLITIGRDAFASCHELKSIYLPDTVTNIGHAAFNYCNALTDVYFAGGECNWRIIEIDTQNAKLTDATIHYAKGKNHEYIAATCTSPKTCMRCGKQEGSLSPHKYTNLEHDSDMHWYECACGEIESRSCHSYTQQKDSKYHWMQCLCGSIEQKKRHNYSRASCTEPETCVDCGDENGEPLGHCYSNDCDTTCDRCSATRTIKHDYKAATCTKAKTCKVCGKTSGKKLGHDYTNDCDTKCNRCGDKRTIKHDYKAATCTKAKTCKVCGKTSGKKLGHDYTNDCDTKCNRCDAKRSITHKYTAKTCGKTTKCSVCGKKGGKLAHSYDNACDTKCNRCGDKRTIKHTYKTTVTKATLKKNGKEVKACTVCGKVSKETTIYKIKTVKLSTTEYTYNGKKRTPTVTVKDSKGNKLKEGTDYTVTYDSGRKNVGEYEVKVKFKGDYSGSKTLTFEIDPKGTTVSKLTAQSKALKVTLKKQTTQTTGYQIEYSTSSKFSSSTKVTISSNKTTSKTIKSLKKGKKYYVRVRTYKVVDGEKFYSDWSKAKSMKTK